MQYRRGVSNRRLKRNHRVQWFKINIDLLHGVTGRLPRFGYDGYDRLTHELDFVFRQRRPTRDKTRVTTGVRQLRSTRQRAKRNELGARINRNHIWRRTGCLEMDRLQSCMRVRGTVERRIQLVFKVYIISKNTSARHKARIFSATNALAYAKLHPTIT